MLHEGFFSAVKFLLGKISCRDKEAVLAIHASIKRIASSSSQPQHAQENCILFPLVQKYLINGASLIRSSLFRISVSFLRLTLAMLIFSFFFSYFLFKNIIFLPGLKLWRGAEQAGRAACRDQSTQSVPCTRVQKQDLRNAGQYF